MPAVFDKIKGKVEDWALELELFFDGLKHRNKHTDIVAEKKAEAQVPKFAGPAVRPSGPASAIAVALNPAIVPAPILQASVGRLIGRVIGKEKKKNGIRHSFGMRMLRFNDKQRLFFYDQLATLITSGVNLIDSLNIIAAQSDEKNIKQLYKDIIHHIHAGTSLAEAMGFYSHIFPPMQTALIEAGEKSGNLKTVLSELVNEMEDSQEFFRKVKGAMFYPLILLVMAVVMVTGMMMFVIPKIAKMYAQSKVKLPAVTQMVINISKFMAEKGILVIIAAVVIITGIYLFFTKTIPGRKISEVMTSKIPLFGRIDRDKNLMIIAGNMAMLLSSGVLIADAFEITQKTLGNLHYQKEIGRIRRGITLGTPISEMMGLKDISKQEFMHNKYFPLQMAQMLHIGETTGTIGKMFNKVRENYHKSIDYTLKNISVVIEPVMILVVAGLVGTILLAVMMPFFYIGQTVG
jgi:type IV pilus assembly protein PilC